MKKKLEGKVAIVTGSGQGVGRGIAIVLAREGASVITNNRKRQSWNNVVVDPNLEEAERQEILTLKGDAEKTASEIIAEGGEAIPCYGNVADFDTAGKLVQKAIDKYGRIDILVNNAAVLGSGMLSEISEADWEYQIVTKLKGAFNCMSHAVPYMVKQKFGRVINISSDAWVGMAGVAAYSAANAGLVGLTKSTSKELYRFDITVNSVCPQAASPGHTTEFIKMKKKLESRGIKINEDMLEDLKATHGPAENMAPFVVYLASEEAAFISGAVFSVTANGRVSIYSEPVQIQTIKKDNSPWTVEELIKVVPEKLLKDYESIAKEALLKP